MDMVKKVVSPTGPASFKTSAFDVPVFRFNVHLPVTAKRRDFSRVGGLLGYACDVANAHRQSVTVPELERPGRELAELLQAAVDGGLENPSDEFLADIAVRFETGVQWTRRLRRTPKGVAFGYDADVANFDGFYALVAVLLMHPKYRLVRRCPQCGESFVRTGKRRFCTDKCATAANDAGVLQRQKNQRLRRAAAELLPHVASHAKRAAAVKQAFKDHSDVTTPEQLAEHAKALLQPLRKHK
ncbi:MAG: hypothetical protein ACRDK4_06465 [Solirubrobacteraceae bacterium]